MKVKSYIRPAVFARRDPTPHIPFSDETEPATMHLGWLAVWCGVGAVVWVTILAAITM